MVRRISLNTHICYSVDWLLSSSLSSHALITRMWSLSFIVENYWYFTSNWQSMASTLYSKFCAPKHFLLLYLLLTRQPSTKEHYLYIFALPYSLQQWTKEHTMSNITRQWLYLKIINFVLRLFFKLGSNGAVIGSGFLRQNVAMAFCILSA